MQTIHTKLLPRYYLITGDEPKKINEFLDKLERCIQNGISLVQIRAKNLTAKEYKNLAKQAITLCHKYTVKVLLNNDVQLMYELGADGVHLPSISLLALEKSPIPKEFILAASCHNEAELIHAKKVNVNFVTLSPVLPTKSHPEATHLGWDRFKKLTRSVNFPIFPDFIKN